MTHPVHTSRAQQARTANPVHEDSPILLEDTGPLPNIPAREGYSQRWISVGGGGGVNRRNIARALQRGWQPRPADTVSKSLQFLMVQHEGMGGVIGTHDMVLMERPDEIQARARTINRNKIRDLEMAVSQNLFREHERLKSEGDGFRPGRLESTARVERGQMQIAQEED